jgi:hypothetical protein
VLRPAGKTLWAHVLHIKNAWSGTSRGFKFEVDDVSAFEADLHASALCKDTPTGKSEHTDMTVCYREMVAGAHGLHACLGPTQCELHIDLHQTVKGKDDDGTCSYSWLSWPRHASDVFLGNVDESPLEKLDRLQMAARWLDQHVGDADRNKEQLAKRWADLKPRIEQIAATGRTYAVHGEIGENSIRGDTEFMTALADCRMRAGMIQYEIGHPEATQ